MVRTGEVYILHKNPRQALSAGGSALFFMAMTVFVLWKSTVWYAMLPWLLTMVSVLMALYDLGWRLKVEPDRLLLRSFFLLERAYPLEALGYGTTWAGFLSPSALDRALWTDRDEVFLSLFHPDGMPLACLDCDQTVVELLTARGVPIEWQGKLEPEGILPFEPVTLRQRKSDWIISVLLLAACLSGMLIAVFSLPPAKGLIRVLALLLAAALALICLAVSARRWRLSWKGHSFSFRPGLGRTRALSFSQIKRVRLKYSHRNEYKLYLYGTQDRLLCPVIRFSFAGLRPFLKKLLAEGVSLQNARIRKYPYFKRAWAAPTGGN